MFYVKSVKHPKPLSCVLLVFCIRKLSILLHFDARIRADFIERTVNGSLDKTAYYSAFP